MQLLVEVKIGLLLSAISTAALAAEPLTLHPVPIPTQSPRLLGMSMDDDGFIWLGSTHRKIYRYDPRTAALDEIPLPYDSSTSQTICVGKKVYLLGQSYPRLMIYDRDAKSFREAAYPSAKPDVWYGTELVDGRYLYLIDRGGVGVIKWDTITDTGAAIPWPYPTILPIAGRYVAADHAVWLQVWDVSAVQYVPIGIARLDVKTDTFTHWALFPSEEQQKVIAEPFSDADTTIFYPHTLKGKLVPFDFKQLKWRQPITVPEFGKRFGFIGLSTNYKDRLIFSISTYNGTQTGCDGKPYHFCNGVMVFDPRDKSFDFPTLDVEGKFFQVSYTLAADGHFFATGNNILEPDGALNNARTGEAIFWQTREVGRK